MNKITKTIFYSVIVLLSAFVLAWIGFNMLGWNAKKEVENYEPDTRGVRGGPHAGIYKAFGIIEVANLDIDIENGSYKNITFNKILTTPGNESAQQILDTIKSNNDLDFDVITGATCTSYFVKAAIKDALEKN